MSALAPEDRCHLNGLGLATAGRRFVTALGAATRPAAGGPTRRTAASSWTWRPDEIIAGGLSMPHSPRWHAGRLWVLESGTGGVAVIDAAAGDTSGRRAARLPPRPRLLRPVRLHGPVAGARSAVFGGVPLAERTGERRCGVWVLHVETGRTVAFLRFEDAVQEVFAVQVLPGARFPDLINADPNVLADSFVLPDETRAALPPAFPSRDLAPC